MKTLQRFFIISASVILMMTGLASCIEDGISTSAADQPTFSTDTVRLGSLFTLDASPTSRFIVYNRHSKGINISSIAFTDDPDRHFRINVDGVAGRQFDNVEIRANDSIFVFVECTLPENGKKLPVRMLAHIEFRTNGVSTLLPVSATGRDVTRLRGDIRFSGAATLQADKPYQIFDSLVVEEGATLTVAPGAELYFCDDARIAVHGTLRVEGDPENPVTMTGYRTGFVAADIPYEIMSGQWRGIEFYPTSSDNHISHASIRNSALGLHLDRLSVSDTEKPALTLVNSQVRNTQGYVIEAIHSNITAAGCELTDASSGIVRLVGGNHSFNHCTFANYYLFTALGGPAVQFEHLDADSADPDGDGLPFLSAGFANCILYGNGTELSHGELDGKPVFLRRCLLKSSGTDDDNFINCLWDTDPTYFTDRQAYIFDYRLRPGSPAATAADPALTSPLTPADRYGTPRPAVDPALGAYQPLPSE